MRLFAALLIGLLYQASAFAAPTKDAEAGTIVFPTNNDYIVVNGSGVQVCNHLDANWTCTLAPGKYRWRDLTAAEEGYFFALNRSNTQGAFPTEFTDPGGSDLPASNYGAVSLAEVQAIIDALVIPDDAAIDARALAVFQANCEVVP